MTEDTTPQWLYWRYGDASMSWANLSEEDRLYWAHEALAVHRMIARGGLRTEGLTFPGRYDD